MDATTLLEKKPTTRTVSSPTLRKACGTIAGTSAISPAETRPDSSPSETSAVPARINVAPALAYPLNASNGFLVAMLAWVAQTASALPFATVATSGITLPLIVLFYVGCVPAAIAESVFPEERWALWAALLVSWTALWLVPVGFGSV